MFYLYTIKAALSNLNQAQNSTRIRSAGMRLEPVDTYHIATLQHHQIEHNRTVLFDLLNQLIAWVHFVHSQFGLNTFLVHKDRNKKVIRQNTSK